MGNINFDEAIKSFKDIGIKIEPDKIIFGVPDARTLLAEGIKHFVQNPKNITIPIPTSEQQHWNSINSTWNFHSFCRPISLIESF